MKLSVIVPAYNEEKTIGPILAKLLNVPEVKEIIVVDDCSSDKTSDVVRRQKNPLVRLVRHKKNAGKGKAIRTGLAEVTGDYVLIQDADSEYDPRDIPLLLEPVKRGRADVVYGSRFFGMHTNMFYWHYLGNKFLNWIVNILYNSILSDMETGYKLIPSKLFRDLDLKSNDFRIEPEITCKLLKRGVKIIEVPISYVGRTYEEGKKITWKDGFAALDTIVTIRLQK
jgi:glycosyltransferase involved in cell wall biosynthesis